jgi:hypothetical protein
MCLIKEQEKGLLLEVNSKKKTMPKQLLLLGDTDTADIKLRLISSDGVECKGNHLYLHSQVLRKYEFYKTMF